MSIKKILFFSGVGCVAVYGGEILLQKLGILESPETATVNKDFQNDIAWNSNNWNTLNRKTFPTNVWNQERVTHYVILQTIASTYPRSGIYTWLENFFVNTLTGSPTDTDIQQAVDYINNHIYCQMEISAILRDAETFYPNWKASYYTNQTWWTKAFNVSNSVLVPLFDAIHHLPNYITLNNGFNDINQVKKDVRAILNSKTVI